MATDLAVIRVETALSRFPLHRLAKAGAVEIAIRERTDAGELRWEVSHNAKFGHPGPLAYKLDTLVINRRINTAKTVPELLKLGSLREIAQELGLGGDTALVKRALHQNASAYLTVKFRYRTAEGGLRSIEGSGTRYTLLLTGETLPDGRVSDAVYLHLNEFYREVLNTATRRPLDYEYLRTLPPAPQRLYELLSYQMYAVLKNGNPTARLAYSEFCRYAPQTRYLTFDQVKKQLYKLHAPHRRSEYIAAVEYQATTDSDGRPDWLILYTPGRKAKAEYKAFNERAGGPAVIEIEPEPTESEAALRSLGVNHAVARELAERLPNEMILAAVAYTRKRGKRVKDPAAYVVSRCQTGSTESTKADSTPTPDQAESQTKIQEREVKDRVDDAIKGMTEDQLADLDATLLAEMPGEIRAQYEKMTLAMKRGFWTARRREYVEGRITVIHGAGEAPRTGQDGPRRAGSNEIPGKPGNASQGRLAGC